MMGLPRARKSTRGPRKDVASTPIQASKSADSPPWFGDNSPIDDSSPIPFLCTQDGSYGENDVIWNYYSPKSRKKLHRNPTDTPVRRRRDIIAAADVSPVSTVPIKKKLMRQNQNKKDFLKGLKEELKAINRHAQQMICSDSKDVEKIASVEYYNSPPLSSSSNLKEIDFPTEVQPERKIENRSPLEDKYGPTINPMKYHLSEKILKCESEGIESDDSMNEYLIRASQLVEEKFQDNAQSSDTNSSPVYQSTRSVKNRTEINNKHFLKPELLEVNNDSFDNLLSNINESYIENLSQAPMKNTNKSGVNIKEKNELNKANRATNSLKSHIVNYDDEANIVKRGNKKDVSWSSISDLSTLLTSSILNDSKSKFSRHKSMPISPDVKSETNSKSASNFSRYNSMPYTNHRVLRSENGPSSISSCTLEEINRKKQAAKERLLAKKHDLLLPLDIKMSYSTPIQQSLNNNKTQKKYHESSRENIKNLHKENGIVDINKNASVANILGPNNKNKISFNTNNNRPINNNSKNENLAINSQFKAANIQSEIERKRKEALQRLRKTRSQLLQKNHF